MKLRNQYFVLRHGESLRNVLKIASCWPEKIKSPLTEKGIRQIKKAAKKLKKKKIDFIYSSDLLRTRQTAEIVGKEIGLKVKLDKRLREGNVGILNNKPIDEIARFWDKDGKLSSLEYFKKRYKIAPDKGENYVQLERRMFSFFREMEKKYKGKNILIVSHQRPITLLDKAVHGHGLEKLVKTIMGKGEIKTGEVRKLA
jgi:broad specificity phosphatase PhoE